LLVGPVPSGLPHERPPPGILAPLRCRRDEPGLLGLLVEAERVVGAAHAMRLVLLLGTGVVPSETREGHRRPRVVSES
jgi:hypothetical protein